MIGFYPFGIYLYRSDQQITIYTCKIMVWCRIGASLRQTEKDVKTMHNEAIYKEMFGMDDKNMEQLQHVLTFVFAEFRTTKDRLYIIRAIKEQNVREAAIYTLGLMEGTLRGRSKKNVSEREE